MQDSTEYKHISVMPQEALDYLNVEPGKIYMDGTLGGAGHSGMILERLAGTGQLYSWDQDINVINRVKETQLYKEAKNWTLVHANFEQIPEYCEQHNIKISGGVLLDLGLSSIQLDDPERGFMFGQEAPLDMRLDPSLEITAADVVNKYREEEIADILYKYGDERKSRQIARKILERRPISSTTELADIVKSIYVRSTSSKHSFRVHPATKSFQALRVFVNRELEVLENLLAKVPDHMEQNARLSVLSFQSQEDRIVKWSFREGQKNGHLEILTKKPILPSDEEVDQNPRSRSAKLRAAQISGNRDNRQ